MKHFEQEFFLADDDGGGFRSTEEQVASTPPPQVEQQPQTDDAKLVASQQALEKLLQHNWHVVAVSDCVFLQGESKLPAFIYVLSSETEVTAVLSKKLLPSSERCQISNWSAQRWQVTNSQLPIFNLESDLIVVKDYLADIHEPEPVDGVSFAQLVDGVRETSTALELTTVEVLQALLIARQAVTTTHAGKAEFLIPLVSQGVVQGFTYYGPQLFVASHEGAAALQDQFDDRLVAQLARLLRDIVKSDKRLLSNADLREEYAFLFTQEMNFEFTNKQAEKVDTEQPHFFLLYLLLWLESLLHHNQNSQDTATSKVMQVSGSKRELLEECIHKVLEILRYQEKKLTTQLEKPVVKPVVKEVTPTHQKTTVERRHLQEMIDTLELNGLSCEELQIRIQRRRPESSYSYYSSKESVTCRFEVATAGTYQTGWVDRMKKQLKIFNPLKTASDTSIVWNFSTLPTKEELKALGFDTLGVQKIEIIWTVEDPDKKAHILKLSTNAKKIEVVGAGLLNTELATRREAEISLITVGTLVVTGPLITRLDATGSSTNSSSLTVHNDCNAVTLNQFNDVQLHQLVDSIFAINVANLVIGKLRGTLDVTKAKLDVTLSPSVYGLLIKSVVLQTCTGEIKTSDYTTMATLQNRLSQERHGTKDLKIT